MQGTGGNVAVSAKDSDSKLVGLKAGVTKAITPEQTEINLLAF